MITRMREKRIATSKITTGRGSLILYSLDNIKKEQFDVLRRELKDTLKGHSGVYALYKEDKVVRVGLGEQIFWRLLSHSRNRKLDWDTASLFIVKKTKYLKDLETAIIRIAKPKYNEQRGRIRDERYLRKILRHSIKEKQRKLRDKRRTKTMEIKKLETDIAKIKKVIGK